MGVASGQCRCIEELMVVKIERSMQTRVLAHAHSWGCTKGVDCRIERSRLDRRRAKSVAMKRYRGSREEVKERVEGVAMGEEEHKHKVSCRRSGECEDEENRTEA